ncbi:BRO-N domain-containing protein [Variovorax sp. GB1P17]|uniref:BRO-N domain-containing protein n=1 Tax=Variovorax sp. GB1P17 TaxID=3443740 RepID=UPI003F44A756
MLGAVIRTWYPSASARAGCLRHCYFGHGSPHRGSGRGAPYNVEGTSIRALEIDGEPYFVGKDVAATLGYVNVSDAIATHCKGVAKRYPLQTGGGVQDGRVISEPDMLRLIVNSSLPAAERF